MRCTSRLACSSRCYPHGKVSMRVIISHYDWFPHASSAGHLTSVQALEVSVRMHSTSAQYPIPAQYCLVLWGAARSCCQQLARRPFSGQFNGGIAELPPGGRSECFRQGMLRRGCSVQGWWWLLPYWGLTRGWAVIANTWLAVRCHNHASSPMP